MKSNVTWPELEGSGICVNDVVPNTVLMDELFDKRALLTEVLGKLMPEWNALPNKNKKPTTSEKWLFVLNVLKKTNVSCTHISKVVEFAVCLLEPSVPAE